VFASKWSLTISHRALAVFWGGARKIGSDPGSPINTVLFIRLINEIRVMIKGAMLRVARPTDNLVMVVEMYKVGLGFHVLAQFDNHNGFDGVILGNPNESYHIEFTHHRGVSVGKAPTDDNLLVFYIENNVEWAASCEQMILAGFALVTSYNPYWDMDGKTYQDVDGYRVVLQNSAWEI